MKRKLTILTCFIALCSFAFGQELHWTPNVHTYNGSMSIDAVINIDGDEQKTTSLEVGAFVGGEVRGSTMLTHVSFPNAGINSYRAQLLIYGEDPAPITFKLFDHVSNSELNVECTTTVTFKDDDVLGNLFNPYQINFSSPVVNVAKIGDVEYTSLQEAENAAKDGEIIVLLEDIVLDGMVTFFNSANPRMLTLDMNNKTITMSDDWDNTTAKSAFWVCDGLTITGNGTINAAPANEAAVYAIIVGHRTAGTTDGNAGTLVIENGTFYGNDASVISVTNGIATINGGTFESPGEFDLNCIDDMYEAGKANITVKGGTFEGFNPENNAVEGAGTNFCAEGYAALPDLNGNFIVGTKPTATVNNLGSVTIPAGDYSIWNGSFDQNTEDDGDMPLSFVMQFIADQNEEDMATSPFADWYGDFVLTFTGIENGSFTADGCYLAGHYGSFGWVKIPVDGMKIEDDARYPVMLGVGLGQKYDYICSSVEDFKCALYLTPEILEANPNIQVNLELAIVDNSQGSDAAASALVENEKVYKVVDYNYDAIDFNMNYVARIGDKGYNTLAEAVEAATGGQTITLLRDAEGSGVIIDKDITINFGGFAYTFVSPAVGSTGTPTQGFQILKDNTVTLQNGTLNVAEDARTAFAMLIQNYAKLTVSDMTLDGDNLDRYTIKDYDYSYVLSNNSGEVSIKGETNIIANPGDPNCEKKHRGIALDACKYSIYAAPIVTVNTTGEIKGIVEVSATLNLEAVGTNNISSVDVTGEGQLYNNIAIAGSVKRTFENDGDENTENDWYTIAVPFAEGHTTSALQTTTDYALYRYNESNIGAEWENVKVNSFNLDLGRGYIYANANNTDVVFTGTFNHESKSIKVSATGEAGEIKGFNLVGNPFSHDITFANLSHTSLAQGFYVLEGDGSWVARNNAGTIKAFQGALIQVGVGGEGNDLTINKNAAKSRSNGDVNGSLAINVANSKYSDVAYVSFNEGLGLTKISHRNAEVPMVYVPVEGKNYAVATMSNDVEEIPFSFEAKTMGQYTISIDAEDSDFARVILVDRLTGEETNMLFEDYTFMAKSNDNPERFVLKLTSKSEMNSNNDDFVYIYKNELFISSTADNAVVEVYDVLGRPVATYNVNGSTNISMDNFSNGVYIVRMIEENDVKVQKILID